MEKKTTEQKAETIPIPEGVQVTMRDSWLTVKGPKGQETRELGMAVHAKVESGVVELTCGLKGKKAKKELGTWKAHIKNMMKGAVEGHSYTLKICASHFPMSVTTEKGKVVVKNFMGEKVPRELPIPEGVSVTITGQEVKVDSTSKERAGNLAANIEKMTKRPKYDKRIFQDGIYITNKDGKAIA